MSAGDTAADPGLWPHQRQAVRAAAAQLEYGGRGLIVMACGTGKTRVGAEVSRRVAPAGKTLVVTPTQELLAQVARVYALHLGTAAGMIGAICAEPAATAGAGEARAEMAHLHAGVSTDPADVAGWLRQPGRATVFTTYASLPAVAAAHDRPRVPGWDLVVVDEAHRAAGRAGRTWSLINDDAAIPAARRLYMTATPRVMSGDADDVASMDDEKVFGPEVFRVSFAQAIGEGLLADYRVVVSVVTSAEVAELAARESVVSSGGAAVPARMLAAQVALLKAASQQGLRRIITYHRRVAAARQFAETLPCAASLLPPDERPPLIRAGSVDGSMRLAGRRQVLRDLEDPGGTTVVVSNSRVLSEGVDVPELDAVAFCDPRDSVTDTVQAVGRALRRGGRESKIATIIIPVLLPETDSTETALAGSEFGAVWQVIRALRAHDERLADGLDRARIALARPGGHAGGSGPEIPGWLAVTGMPDGTSFAGALHVRIVGTATSPWLDGYARAAAFHEVHGHLDVPQSYRDKDGFRLGSWVSEQRRGRTPRFPDRAAALDKLGMIWDLSGYRWEAGLAAARDWRSRHGNLDVPRDHATPEGLRLADWLTGLRHKRERGTLDDAQIAALDALGIGWQQDRGWTRGLEAARAYHAEHGHINVPNGDPPVHGVNLDNWVRARKDEYRQGVLDPARAHALEELGITWRHNDQRWDEGLRELAGYKEAHGHVNVLRRYVTPGGYRLGQWLSRQRSAHNAGQLPPGRAAALEQLGVRWSTADPGSGNR